MKEVKHIIKDVGTELDVNIVWDKFSPLYTDTPKLLTKPDDFIDMYKSEKPRELLEKIRDNFNMAYDKKLIQGHALSISIRHFTPKTETNTANDPYVHRFVETIDIPGCMGIFLFPDAILPVGYPREIAGHDPSANQTGDSYVLHAEEKPAVIDSFGNEYCFWQGRNIPNNYLLGDITLENIDNEQNAELRTFLMQRYGALDYFSKRSVKEFHSDDHGTLWKNEPAIEVTKKHKKHHQAILAGRPDDVPASVRELVQQSITYVAVVNSTPSPDGSYRDYYLPVPPVLATAHDAVAWTFRRNAPGYNLTEHS